MARPLSAGRIIIESSVLMADSTVATISVAGMLVGVTVKFNPFSSNDTSASLRDRNDKLITHLFLSTRGVWSTCEVFGQSTSSTFVCLLFSFMCLHLHSTAFICFYLHDLHDLHHLLIISLERLKCQATGLDESLSFLSTSRSCLQKRSPSLLPVSPMYIFIG